MTPSVTPTTPSTNAPDPDTLQERWDALRQAEPRLRIRDAATRLETSEAALLALGCGRHVTRLSGDFSALLQQAPTFGDVMCLTRNEHAVHERYGCFEDVSFNTHTGLVLGKEIDLRLFMNQWAMAFAVVDETDEGPRRSFQFFDRAGTAVHKIYLFRQDQASTFEKVTDQFRSDDQTRHQSCAPLTPPKPDKPDAEIDVEGFRAAWLATADTHDFFPLLRKFGVGRHQALRLAPEGYAIPVEPLTAQPMLEAAAADSLPIMVFIGSPGCIQIHTGPVQTIKRFGDEWINVLDDRFNMHLRDRAIGSAWIVRKVTADGVVTSLELFDTEQNNVVLFFGKRKPGQPEDPAWRQLAEKLASTHGISAHVS